MSIFSQNERTKLRKNVFDLTHDLKGSGKMGVLMPFLCMDVIPGDKVSISSATLLRFAPMIAPVMHRVSVYQHYFFVPNRILWDNWEDFITGGKDGNANPTWPYLDWNTGGGINLKGSLGDYLGLPLQGRTNVSAFPFAAYQAIYNEYYRDQNLTDEKPYKLVDGQNGNSSTTDTSLNRIRLRAWQHDYFTSALPFTQRGPEAMIPIGDEAPIVQKLDAQGKVENMWIVDAGFLPGQATQVGLSLDSGTSPDLGKTQMVANTQGGVSIDFSNSHFADLSQATASSISDLRRAFKLQEWLEKAARGGARYTEVIKSFFGVTSSDARLQRPEYLGGSMTPVKISEVLQTSETGSTPQANMSGHAVAVGQNKHISMFAEEHGYIMGIMSIMPKTAYQQGVPKHFRRFDKFEYYWPQFAHIGEQEITGTEIYLTDSSQTNKEVFGYIPRYSEYKYMNDKVCGDFRDTLDFWHLGRKFGSKPALNEDFIMCDPLEVDRIFAVQDGTDNLWFQVLNTIKAARPMPYFGEPKFG